MSARPQLPGTRWFLWMRNASLRLGALTGVYLCCVFVSWLLIANRFPQLESFAGIRNLAGGTLVILLMFIPVFRFRSEPVNMFVSGLTAWTLLSFVYLLSEMRFSLLESRMGALQVFILGVSCYGFAAVFQWVFLLCVEARQRHIAQSEQAVAPSGRPPAN